MKHTSQRRRFLPGLVLILLAWGGGLVPAGAADKAVPQSRTEIQLSYAPLVKKAAPAVVNIYTRKVVQTRPASPLFNDPFFRQFFGDNFGMRFGRPRERVQNSLGSGVIVDPEGVIVTNYHVIDGADEITVALSDRREFEAKVTGVDKQSDLAILRIDTGGDALPFLELRDSDDLEVGDLVLAIGDPFGVGQTVTSGIVSALARTQVGISDLNFFIQTDAAINPGNSGGALVTMDGRLAGINSAIFSKSGGSHGIGFAIPSNMVRSVLSGLTEDGRLVRPWLGAWGQAVKGDVAVSLGLERPAGVLISQVYPGGPADKAHVGVGDVILAVNGHEVNDEQALKFRIATLAIGDRAELSVWSRGKERTRRLTLAAPEETPPRDQSELSGHHPLEGTVVANMSPALAQELGIEPVKPGVFIIKMRRGSTADRLNFEPGDEILAINGDKVDSVRDLRNILNKRVNQWRVTLERKGKTMNWTFEP